MVVVLSSEQVLTGLEAPNNKFMEEAEIYKAKCCEKQHNNKKSLTFLADQFGMEEYCEQELMNKQIEAHHRAADEEFEAYYLGIPYSPKNKSGDDNRKPIIRVPLMTMATCSTSSSRTSCENLAVSIITTTDNVDDGYFFLDYVTIPRRKRSWRKDLGLVIDKQAQHDLVVHEQQNYLMNKMNDKHNKKRKERRSLQSPQLPVHKKVKRANNVIDREDSIPPGPEPEMPAHIRDSITRLGGTPPVWLTEKELTASDLSWHLMRLFIPKNTRLATYMTKEEKALFSKVKSLVPLIDPLGNLTQIHLRIWTCLNLQPLFTSYTWKRFMNEFKLRAHSDTLQIWCFRLPAERGSELCFAVNLIRKQPSLHIA